MPDLPEHLRKQLIEYDGPPFPLAPPDGGVLVLTRTQMANADLIAAIRYVYPETKIIEARPIPLEKPDAR